MSEKKSSGQFKESESGLRDVSYDEGVPTGSWKHRLHYVPLAILLAGACAATSVGVWYQSTHPSPASAPAPASAPVGFNRTTAQAVPEACAPTPRADVGPWTPGVAGTAGYLPTDAADASFQAGMTGVSTYVEGRDGYFFLSDVFNANFSQALGRVRPNADQIGAWDRYMTAIEQAGDANGATTMFLPAPATWDVYSDKLPQWTDPLRGTTSMDLMRTALPAHPWVDVRQGLVDARATTDAPLYSAVNPHWSPYAAHVAWNQTLTCLGALNPSLSGLPSLTPSGVSTSDAPNEYEGLGAPSATGPWAIPTYAQDPGSVRMLRLDSRDELADASARMAEVTGAPEVSLATPIDFENKPALTYNSNGRGTALIVRDSQGNNLGPDVAATFEYTIQVGHALDAEHPTDVASLIEAYHPSVVIVEFTQRYLALTPGSPE